MRKTGRSWKRADKEKLEKAVQMVKDGKGVLEVANHLGLSYGQVYRAYKRSIDTFVPEGNSGEEAAG